MKTYTIEETKCTPSISLDPSGVISLSGRSFPENTFKFYTPMMEWLEEYFENSPAEKTVVSLNIIYINSSSSRQFFDFFDLLEENCEEHKIEISWIYDEGNDSGLEAGEDYQDDFPNLNIKLVEKPN
ncbi:MAG: DUF1987 domain-containing protein [Helicobacteraceae bacterium]|nr:DUF1987 domain-containing protein [Helicobacteraceae bacterium]